MTLGQERRFLPLGIYAYPLKSRSVHGQGSDSSGTIHKTYLFSQIVTLEELDTVTIDGMVYQVQYEIG